MFTKLTLVLISIFLVACNNKDESKLQDCTIVACTQNFVTITVSIKDASGISISLDEYEVIDNESGEKLTIDFSSEEYQHYKEQGLYPILSDAYRVQYQNSTASITFKGFISDNEVVTEEYIIGADCCHVSLLSGNTEIVLD